MAIKQRIEELIDKYVPPAHRAGFSFHAKDLFHGSGLFDKRICPREHSRAALMELLQIPAQFQLPIVCGYLRKRSAAELRKQQRRDEPAKNQAMAYSLCAVAAEKFMRHLAKSEVAHLVAENNNETRQAVKLMHRLLSGRHHSLVDGDLVSVLIEFANGYIPIRRIVDIVHFAEKEDAFLLQLADACSLMIRYFFEGRTNAEEFLDTLTQGNLSVLGNREETAGYSVVTFTPIEA